MSEREGPQGVQGEQGVRGLQGPTGDGNGEPGPQGEKGDTGASGPLNRNVTAAFVLLVVVATVASLIQGYAIQENAEKIDRLQTVEVALCTFRDDLTRRVTTAEMFLGDVEAGRRPPIQGISTNDLERSIDGQRSTLNALRQLDCEEE